MSTSSSLPPVSASPDDLRAVIEAFEERTVVVQGLASEVTALVGEVRNLRTVVTHRPPRREVERNRRRSVLAVAIWSVLLVLLLDQHTEACGPGVEAKNIINKTSNATPVYCTVLFPFHTHDDDVKWPSDRAFLGMGLYALIASGGILWVVRPSRRVREEEQDEEVEDAAR